ncbi:hypothetical protein D9758_001269 [Tetrapyrgos nigripes]|uniref:Uncharacterized protein n=1 Tax=Tetrapyrgos nigripes TaxID=182062 RepID=A0A8H5LUL3_9AGAR|nr:hypothetical protein D9758_001269 [Tetrapyrgos nigripes]
MSTSRVTRTLQQAALRSRIFQRYNSTSSPQPHPKPNYTLPPEKLRALISLYHQTDTFITKENLSDRIDEAFIRKDFRLDNAAGTPGMKALREEVQRRRAAPRFSEWEMERGQAPTRPGDGGAWSTNLSLREWKVIEALYGVDSSAQNRTLPGLESLEEWEESDAERLEKVKEEEWTKLLQKEAEEEQKLRRQHKS